MRIFFLLFAFSICAKPLEVSVSAASAILMNADSGAILYEKNSRSSAYPASTTKIATALYILETQRLPLEKKVIVSGEALRMRPKSSERDPQPHWLIPEGTKMGLLKGEEVSVEALLHGLMLVSGNDAANTLAEAHSGSVGQFMDEVNAYLRNEVGCVQTQFCNPHGLHWGDHFSTAYDLALVAKRALRHEQFREISTKTKYLCPKTNKRASVEIQNFNPLLKPGGRHYYSKAIGIKTGYTDAAMNNLVAAAEHEGRVLIAVVLGCKERSQRCTDVIRLFEAAFRETKIERELLNKQRIFSHDLEGASEPLRALLADDLKVEYFPSEEPQCKAVIEWEDLELPLKKGQKVGEVHVFDQNQELIQRQDLIAKEDLKATFFFSLKQRASKIFFPKP
jgi:D-alanyl-D-alanine carboxypeptidase (penicillin-binding protein 5/6)